MCEGNQISRWDTEIYSLLDRHPWASNVSRSVMMETSKCSGDNRKDWIGRLLPGHRMSQRYEYGVVVYLRSIRNEESFN